MTPLFVDRVTRPEPHGAGFAQFEGEYRKALERGTEIRIDAGKRGEYPVAPGEGAVLYVLQGAVRFEGDDTPAGEGDTVWFKPAAAGENAARLGIEADMPFRGVLVTGRGGAAAS